LYTLCRIVSRVGGPTADQKHKKGQQKVVHFAPDSIVHYSPEFIVHYTPEYSIGLEFNISSISNIGLLVAVIAVSYLSKIAGGYFGGTLAGLSKRVSLTLGIGLNARGIMELVIANIAYRNGLISTEVFSILVIMGVLTTLTTPLLLKRAFGRLE
jgi:hypothetical protein